MIRGVYFGAEINLDQDFVRIAPGSGITEIALRI